MLSLNDPVTTSLELDVGPAAGMALATPIREFLANVYGPVLQDSRTESLLTLAAHELVENIIKYATTGRRSLTVQLDTGKREVRIITANEATPAQITRLRAKLDRICASETPEQLYDEFIVESAGSPVSGESGLGLIRLRAEADMHLAYTVEGTRVKIEATLQLPDHDLPAQAASA